MQWGVIENMQNDYALYLEIQVFNDVFFSCISGKHLWLIIKKDEKEFQTITPDFFKGPTKNVLTVKVREIRNDLFKPTFLPKNQQRNSTLLLVDFFSFVFWKKVKTPKDISKLIDL